MLVTDIVESQILHHQPEIVHLQNEDTTLSKTSFYIIQKLQWIIQVVEHCDCSDDLISLQTGCGHRLNGVKVTRQYLEVLIMPSAEPTGRFLRQRVGRLKADL